MSDPITNPNHKPIIINEMQTNQHNQPTMQGSNQMGNNDYYPTFTDQPQQNPQMYQNQPNQQNNYNPNIGPFDQQVPVSQPMGFNPTDQGDYTNQDALLQDEDTNEQQNVFVFQKPNVRQAFIRKVYLILSAQLLITTVFGYFCMYKVEVKDFMMQNPYVVYVALGCMLVSTYALLCYDTCARTVPLNFIMLFIFTASESVMVGYTVMLAQEENVIIALVMASTVVVALTLYAIFSKTDFTMCGGLLSVLCLVLLAGYIMNAFFIKGKTMQIGLSLCGAILFGIYLIYDTQLIVGGRSHELSVDDYIVGALNLYIDIISIFLDILSILESR